MQLTRLGILGFVLASSCRHESSFDESAIEKVHAANDAALKAICGPPLDQVAKSLDAPIDPITQVAPLTSRNAAVLGEVYLSGRLPGTRESKVRGGEGLLFENSRDFVTICNWASAPPYMWPDGFSQNQQSLDLVQMTIRDALAIRYFVVIRIVDGASPTENRKSPYARHRASDSREFTPGYVVAEARIFDTKGRLHGGFRFEARSASTIETSVDVDGNGYVVHDETWSALQNDLKTRLSSAFAKKLGSVVAGSTLTLP